MKVGVFAGTFDPVTIGHEQIIKKAVGLFDKLIVAICINQEKDTYYSVETRLEMLKAVCEKYPNVEVVYHQGLLVDLLKEKGATYSVRGVRNNTDYLYENNMHFVNKKLYPDIVTIFIPCDENLLDVSSTAVRKAIENNVNYSECVSKEVFEIIEKLKG